MDHISTRDLKPLLTFISTLYSVDNLEKLTENIVTQLPTLISADIYSYEEINTRCHRASSKWAPSDVTMIPDGLSILARHANENPIVSHFKSTGDGQARMVSDFLPQRQFRSCTLYQEFYKHYRIPFHLISALFIQDETTITISYHRDRKEFTERDRLILNLIRPHVTQAFENIQRTSALLQDINASRSALDTLTIPLLFASRDGRILWMSLACKQLLQRARLSPYKSRLPSAIFKWAKQQDVSLDTFHAVPNPCAPLLIVGPTGALRISRFTESAMWIFLLEETATGFPIEHLEHLEHLEVFGLSARETEILGWIAQGKTNPEIGTILGISPRTVQKHLERVYVRLGVENRHAAMTMAMEAMNRGKMGNGYD